MQNDDDDYMGLIRSISAQGRAHRNVQIGSDALSRCGTDLDDRLNFRVNSGLKSEFEKLCKLNHTTPSREIKRFMRRSIESQEI